jgi:hypothetical protein
MANLSFPQIQRLLRIGFHRGSVWWGGYAGNMHQLGSEDVGEFLVRHLVQQLAILCQL